MVHFDPQSNQASFHSRHVYYMDGQWYTILRSVFRFSYKSKTVKQKNRPSLNSQGRSLTIDVWQGWPFTTLDKRCWCVSSVVVIVLICDLDEKTMIKVGKRTSKLESYCTCMSSIDWSNWELYSILTMHHGMFWKTGSLFTFLNLTVTWCNCNLIITQSPKRLQNG